MTILEQITGHLKGKYLAGEIQQEIAEQLNISQQYVQRLLSGQRDIDGITIKTLSKMFPQATISLHGDNNIIIGIAGDNNTGNIVTGKSRDIKMKSREKAKSAQLKYDAIMKILEMNLEAESKKRS